MNKGVLAIIAIVVVGGIIFASKEVVNGQPVPVEAAATSAAVTEEQPPQSEETQPVSAEAPAPQDTAAAAPQTTGLVTPVVYGSADAPVTIEEYASFTCSHCATFHNERLPALQEKFFASGKARLLMNSFVRNEQDLRATMLIQCLKDNDQRQRFVKALLQAQEQWAYSADFVNNLRVIAQVGGVGNAEFDACMADKDLETAVVQSRESFLASRKIESTPFFVIGDQNIKGVRELEVYEQAIEAAAK